MPAASSTVKTKKSPIKLYINQAEKIYHRILNPGRQKGASCNALAAENHYLFKRQYACIVDGLRARRRAVGRRAAADRTALAHALASEYLENEIYTEDSLRDFLERVGRKGELDATGLLLFFDMLRLLGLKRICLILEEERRGVKQTDGCKKILDVLAMLRLLDNIRPEKYMPLACPAERLLLEDEVYRSMTGASRQVYREQIEKMAQKQGTTVLETVRGLMSRSKKEHRHIGFFIDFPRHLRAGSWYFAIGLIFCLALTVGFWALTDSILLTLLFLLPAYATAKFFTDYIYSLFLKNTRFVRLRKDSSILNNRRVCVIIPSLLDAESVKNFSQKLERLYLQNRDANAVYGMLFDFPESESALHESDQLCREQVESQLRQLNEKYDQRFFAMVRNRTYSKTQQKFIGRDRKRGAIEELVHYIRTGKASDAQVLGGIPLTGCDYLFSIDADTTPSIDSVRSLATVMAHPLNTPVFDERKRKIISGYGILSPALLQKAQGSFATPFARLQLSVNASYKYSGTHHNLFQDLFSEGSFSGKGLIDIAAYDAVLSGRFTPERILSHDLLEGCLLRTGYVSDISFAEGQPKTVKAYIQREHRWIRGDWQLLSVLRGLKLGGVAWFKIFDNMRRSLTPVMSVALMFAGLFFKRPVSLWCAMAGLLPVIMPVALSFLRQMITGDVLSGHVKYYSRVPAGVWGMLAFCGFEILALPFYAANAVDAVLRALYRQFVSGRRLLDWTVFSEAAKTDNLFASYRFFAAGTLLSAVLLVSSLALGVGPWPLFLLWLSVPTVFYRLSKSSVKAESGFSPEDREAVTGWAGQMWEYVRDHLTQQDNFLLPDNVQVSPPVGIAHRTSPTNIGLSLVSVLCARDFGFISTEQAVELVEKILDGIDKLERYKGHLYNWYETNTLKTLEPRYVSTVDSGNLAVCLRALRVGLSEYADEHAGVAPLLTRLQKLEYAPDFKMLYNPEKKMMHIGLSLPDEELSNNYYDLIMSESRLTSYYLCARGVLPYEHWYALERVFAVDGGHYGNKSWTGTMFEYFMPCLFTPSYEGTSYYETMHFAFHAQKSRTGTLPFGISESCYYAFDNLLNYRYKAMGVSLLGQKRGLNEDLVVSPYSTFLTLPFFKHDSLENLRRMEKDGYTGKYGFFEAVDFTPARTGGHPGPVKCFMAHHIGMSLVSCVNALMDGRFIRRFMRASDMSAFDDLLSDGLPRRVYAARDEVDQPQPLPLHHYSDGAESPHGIDPGNPRMTALSNGEYTALVSDSGAGYGIYRDKSVSVYRKDHLREVKGIYFVLETQTDIIPLTKNPFCLPDVKYSIRQYSDVSVFYARRGGIECRVTVTVPVGQAGESRIIEILNHSGKPMTGKLLCYFEPALAHERSERAHPGFNGLTLESRPAEGLNAVIYRRRPREIQETGLYLCAGFDRNCEHVAFETNKNKAVGFGNDEWRILNALRRDLTGPTRACLNPCFAAKTAVSIAPGQQASMVFALGCGESSQAAVDTFTAIESAAVQNLPPDRRTGETDTETLLESMVLPALVYPCTGNLPLSAKNKHDCATLWSYGVSGDFPYILLNIHETADTIQAEPYLRLYQRLRQKQAPCEIVFVFREGGQYDRPVYTALMSAVFSLGLEKEIGRRGGVHLCNLSDEAHAELFEAKSAYIVRNQAASGPSEGRAEKRIRLKAPGLPSLPEKPLIPTLCGGFTRDGFMITDKRALDERPPWCNVLANAGFGTVLSDASLGFSFFRNANLFKLTPWSNDTVTGDQGEKLLIKCAGSVYDAVSGGLCRFSCNRAEYRSRAGGINITVTVTIPPGQNAKRVDVDLENTLGVSQNAEVMYGIVPVLGQLCYDGVYDISRFADGYFVRNTFSPEFSQCTAFLYCERAGLFSRDRAAFLSGSFRARRAGDLFVACGKKISLQPREKRQVRFVLGCEGNPETARAAVARLSRVGMDFPQPARPLVPLRIHTPDKALDLLVNNFLYAQVILGRINARSGFYQCSGAYGFRDQLQDCMSVCTVEPNRLRRQIIRSCLHQFELGDVMHWWHHFPQKNIADKGVRTRCSDDLLWLPLAVAEYVEKSSDTRMLDKPLPYLDAPELAPGEQERYFAPGYTAHCESVYRHCLRAFTQGLRYGEKGMLLFGTGDWNDGYSNVGARGVGESVWLSMFAVYVINRFLPICESRADTESMERLTSHRDRLIAAVEEHGWDGDWYKRGFYDNGNPIGSRECDECQIDLLPQMFAQICGVFDKTRTTLADQAVETLLVDRQAGLLKLFTPAFSDTVEEPGYVKGYVAGIRENGGQYSHGACFAAYGRYLSGRHDAGYELLQLLNPVRKYLDGGEGRVYKNEPYVLSGDVYSAPEHNGRGGWSWYTGAAGWYFRIVLEELLGLKRTGKQIRLTPKIPSHWNKFSFEVEIEGTQISVQAERDQINSMLVDGVPAGAVELDGKRHEVKLRYS